MIDIPKYYKDKLIKGFGGEIERWSEGLPDLANQYIEKWKLSHNRVYDNLSYNFIMFGKSQKYGDVVLKIGIPGKENISEIRALEFFKGKNVCRLYESDVNNYTILLEDIKAKGNLKSVEKRSTRYEIFCNIVKNLNTNSYSDEALCKYDKWIMKAFEKHRVENNIYPSLIKHTNIAEKLFWDLNSRFDNELIHGDLHHENVLLSESGDWKVIDPKGVIGFKSLEVGRFVLNELDLTSDSYKNDIFNQMVDLFSEKLNYSRDTIIASCFIDSVLSTVWFFEEDRSFNAMKIPLERCELIHKWIR